MGWGIASWVVAEDLPGILVLITGQVLNVQRVELKTLLTTTEVGEGVACLHLGEVVEVEDLALPQENLKKVLMLGHMTLKVTFLVLLEE